VRSIDANAEPLPPFDPPAPHSEAINTEYYLGSAQEEAKSFAEFASQIRKIQEKQASDHGQPMQRGFHAKAHGCVAAQFNLLPERDARTRFGLFSGRLAQGKVSWPAWVRFSNAVGWRQSDNELDARGMAVKVLGVPGKKLSDEEAETQDFLMTNSPTPVGGDAVDFMAFADANARGQISGLGFAVTHAKRGAQALMGTTPIASAVAETYWSGGAFHLGAHQAIKFLAKPCATDHARNPAGAGAEGLRADLKAAAAEGFCFRLYVQFQSDAFRTPIEDAAREWSELDSPPVPVAEITVPPQTLDDPARDRFCEKLSFNPWHALPAHQPMGHINRARKYVYGASNAYRGGGIEPKSLSVPP
jgi:hypothetical protein